MRKGEFVFFTKTLNFEVSEMLALSSEKSAFDQNQSKNRFKRDKEHDIFHKTLQVIYQPRGGVLSLM